MAADVAVAVAVAVTIAVAVALAIAVAVAVAVAVAAASPSRNTLPSLSAPSKSQDQLRRELNEVALLPVLLPVPGPAHTQLSTPGRLQGLTGDKHSFCTRLGGLEACGLNCLVCELLTLSTA